MVVIVNVVLEIVLFKCVIIYCFDEGIVCISLKWAEEFLFDDIVYLLQMQEEYDVFLEILKYFVGEDNVFEIEDFFFEVFEVVLEVDKREMIEKIIDYEELLCFYEDMFLKLDNKVLMEMLIMGYLQ